MVSSPNYNRSPDTTGLGPIFTIYADILQLLVRTSTDHFKQFLEEMDRRGLDLSKVHLTKGEIMLWG